MSIFRAYDIRGVYGRDFNDDFAESVGRAFGSTAEGTVAVGRDMRLSGEALSGRLIAGLQSAGVDVVDIGVVPTPLLYFAANYFKYGSGVMITASHNPAEYNGFKFLRNYETLHGRQISNLKALIDKRKFRKGAGSLKTKDVTNDYVQFVKERIRIQRKIKVVLDSGNGMGGVVAPRLLRELGCDVVELYSKPDGSFPNHHPDPTVDENLKQLVKEVVKQKADFGVGFDGDADRAGFVDDRGRIMRGDQALILFAREVLKKHKGAKIICEVKCSQAVEEEVLKHGGVFIMYRTGHSFIKQKIREEKAALAGEMSGHFYFADNYYGFDDAIYATARMAELLSKSNESLSVLVDGMPKYYSTPEIRVECPDDRKFQVVDSVTKEFQEKYEVNTIDGARVKFNHGWGLVRASNTQPALILRMESKTQKGLEEIKKEIQSTVEKHL